MLLNNTCVYCRASAVLTDAAGFRWCEAHQHRGLLLNWGARHCWPDLQCYPYAIGPSAYCWGLAATAGLDEFVKAALAAIEYLESSEV